MLDSSEPSASDDDSRAIVERSFRELAAPFAEVVGAEAIDDVISGVQFSSGGGGLHFDNSYTMNVLQVLLGAVSCVVGVLQLKQGDNSIASREQAVSRARNELLVLIEKHPALRDLVSDGEVTSDQILRVIAKQAGLAPDPAGDARHN